MKSLEGIIRDLVDEEAQSRRAAAEKTRLDKEQDEGRKIRRTLDVQQLMIRGKAVSRKEKMVTQLENSIANHNAILFMISQGKERGLLRKIENQMSRSRSELHSNPRLEQIYRSYGVDLDLNERKMEEEAKRKASEWFLEQSQKNPDIETLKRLREENLF